MRVHFNCLIGVKKGRKKCGYFLHVFGEQGWRSVKSTTSRQCGLGSSPGVNALCAGLLLCVSQDSQKYFGPLKKHSIGAQNLLTEMRF